MTDAFSLEGVAAMEAYWVGAYVAYLRSRTSDQQFNFAEETARALARARADGDIIAWCQRHMNAREQA